MIRIMQFAGIIFSIIMLIISSLLFFKRKISSFNYILWNFVWFFLIVGIIIFDEIKAFVETVLQVQIFDLFSIIFFGFLLVNVYLMNKDIKRNKEKIEEIVEKIAYRDYDSNK